MSFSVAPLPFDQGALASKGLSKDQVSVHYEKHHKGYATKLNAAAESNPDLKSKSLLEVIKTTSGPVFNSAAQIFNHDFFWKSLSPDQGGKPSGAILKAIEESFGTFEKFKEEFTAAAVGHFGSGWVWLVKDTSSNKLKVLQTHDAANPLTEANLKPILTCDLWEHAYYIDYKNDRAAFINTFWNLVNWKFAESQLVYAGMMSFNYTLRLLSGSTGYFMQSSRLEEAPVIQALLARNVDIIVSLRLRFLSLSSFFGFFL
eukprot:gene13243-9088_t